MNENQDNMIVNKNYVEQLTNLGLTQGEAKVYLAMIQIGPSRIGKIVEISGVSQSKVYNVLDRLILKGLASYNIQDNIKHFQSLEPSRIQDYILKKEEEVRKQKEDITQIIKDLSKNIYATKRSASARGDAGCTPRGGAELRGKKDMKAEEIDNLLSFFKTEFVVRNSEITETEAEEISEEIKSNWWKKNKPRIEDMISEND